MPNTLKGRVLTAFLRRSAARRRANLTGGVSQLKSRRSEQAPRASRRRAARERGRSVARRHNSAAVGLVTRVRCASHARPPCYSPVLRVRLRSQAVRAKVVRLLDGEG